jgi:DNA-binding NtrC family response regulator
MKGKSLLIVDDDPRSLYAFGAVLQAHDFHVIACDCAETAVDHDGTHFDAAIIDVRLPKMQGTQLAEKLRQEQPRMRIILITAYDGIDEIKNALPGCHVLLKPVDMETLLGLL